MAQAISIVLLLGLWTVNDDWLIAHAAYLQESDLQRWFKILAIKDDQWMFIKRYKDLQRFRWLGLILILIQRESWMWLAYGLGMIVIYKLPYWNIKIKAKQRILMIRYQFPIYLRQLQVLLQNNTVVKAIEASLDQAPSILKDDIHLFYQNLLMDPLKLNTYINCMQQYELPEIQRAMKWLYRYQSIGYQDAYRQFNRMITSTSKWLRQSRLDSKNQSLQLYQWLGLLPLFGVTLVFLSAMMSVALTFFERR